MINDLNKKQLVNDVYISGQETSTDKMYKVMDFYKALFPKFSLIDITSYLDKDNYKLFLVKNYSNKTIMFAEKNQLNEDFFNSKSNSEDVDIIIMFAGGYKVIDSKNIEMYTNNIKAWIS
jgi:hypothetical protein